MKTSKLNMHADPFVPESNPSPVNITPVNFGQSQVTLCPSATPFIPGGQVHTCQPAPLPIPVRHATHTSSKQKISQAFTLLKGDPPRPECAEQIFRAVAQDELYQSQAEKGNYDGAGQLLQEKGNYDGVGQLLQEKGNYDGVGQLLQAMARDKKPGLAPNN